MQRNREYNREHCNICRNLMMKKMRVGIIMYVKNERDLQAVLHIIQVYVDTVGDPKKYQKKLELEFPQLQITVEKKADARFPIVSAASICAKVCMS